MTAPVGIAVGAELPPRQPSPTSRTTLALFATASGGHNPIHIDVDFALIEISVALADGTVAPTGDGVVAIS